MPFSVDIKYIAAAEKDLDVIFPLTFKIKMQKQNGGEVTTEFGDCTLFPFLDKTDNKRISRTCNHIALETKNAKKWDNFPNEAIAIGQNGYGDFLILLPKQDKVKELADTIFLWQHDTSIVVKVADKITDLD